MSLLATEKRGRGRPPRYKSKEEIEGLIDQYFKECEGTPLVNEDGVAVLDKYGDPVMINRHPPTVTGLALALGFTTRLGLLNYQTKPEFMNTIMRAKSRIEQYTEERLFDRDGVNGAKFSLKNNFKGWSDNPDAWHDDVTETDNFIEALNSSAAEDWKDEKEQDI